MNHYRKRYKSAGKWVWVLPSFVVITLCLKVAAIASSHTNQKALTTSDVEVLSRERQSGDKFSEDLRKAWEAYGVGNSNLASSYFQKVFDVEQSNDSERVQALYGLAVNAAYGTPERPKKAKKYFKQIAEQYPQNTVAAWALLKLGQLEGTDTSQQRQIAREYYRRLLEQYPDSLAIHESVVRLAGTYFHELDPNLTEIGTEILEKHLEKYPDNPLASIMRFRLFYWYAEVEKDYDRAIKHGAKLGEMKMANSDRWGQQYWSVAQIYLYKLNEPQEALKWYKKIVDERSRDLFVFPAKQKIKQITEQLEIQSKIE
jgi:tetratricopeptide (TPR) repeat protein